MRKGVYFPKRTPFAKAPILGSTATIHKFFVDNLLAETNKRQLTKLPVNNCGPETTSGREKAMAGSKTLSCRTELFSRDMIRTNIRQNV